MNNSSFLTAIAALRCGTPTVDELDAADALEVLQDHHLPAGNGVTCPTCAGAWPCEAWNWGEQLALQSLGQAADRVYAHAKQVMDHTRQPVRLVA